MYIWNRIARHTHCILFWSSLEISEGSFFNYEPQISVSSTKPKWEIQTQNTVDGKEDISWGISHHQVVWIRLIKHKQALNLPMYRPFSWIFFFNISLRWGVIAWLRRVRKSYLFPGTKQTVRDIVVSFKPCLTVCGILSRLLTSSDVSSGTNYTISSLTGDMDGADTDANVYITLYGEKGDSGFRKLDTKHFSRGK